MKKISKNISKQKNKEIQEYLGSDGQPISVSYSLYIKKCIEFRAKAKKYKQENLSLKNSFLHHEKPGYESSEILEEQILKERIQHFNYYKKIFDLSNFFDDPNLMYENSKGQTKRIRIIRELENFREENFSENFDKEGHCWFSRYCILSKFIQAARRIIIKNRLEKKLRILKYLSKEQVAKLEAEIEEENESSAKSNQDDYERALLSPYQYIKCCNQ